MSRPQPLQSSCAHIQAAARAGSYGHVVVEPVAELVVEPVVELVVEPVVELAAAVSEPARVDDPSVGCKGVMAVKGLPSPTAGGGGPFEPAPGRVRIGPVGEGPGSGPGPGSVESHSRGSKSHSCERC